jgi:hypothetical protein
MKITDQISAPTRDTLITEKDLATMKLSEFLEHIQNRINLSFVGLGTPEGQITAGVGSIYHRLDGGANTSFYVKESGTSNTGWTAK